MYLTIKEVCDLTTYKQNYIYKLVHQDKIPFVQRKKGGKLLFLKSEIEDFIRGLWENPNTPDTEKIEKEVQLYLMKQKLKSQRNE